jgi:hypothetical protein
LKTTNQYYRYSKRLKPIISCKSLKSAKRLQRSCNRPDVRLYHNRSGCPITRNSLAVTLENEKELKKQEMRQNELSNADELMSKMIDDERAKRQPHKVASPKIETR